MRYYTLYFGQAYGEGAYGSNAYSCTQEQIDAGTCATAAGGTSGGGGGLADTGIAMVGIVTLACLLVFIALVVRVWRRPKLAAQEAEVTASDQPQVTDLPPRE